MALSSVAQFVASRRFAAKSPFACRRSIADSARDFRTRSPLCSTVASAAPIFLAPVVFGANVFGWTADKATSFELLDRFVDAGLNAVDTADAYSAWAPGNKGGELETIIGEWMKSRGKRDDVIVITKVGSPKGAIRGGGVELRSTGRPRAAVRT